MGHCMAKTVQLIFLSYNCVFFLKIKTKELYEVFFQCWSNPQLYFLCTKLDTKKQISVSLDLNIELATHLMIIFSYSHHCFHYLGA